MKKVSCYTHTKAQLDNYANQKNPNNKADKANAKSNNCLKPQEKRRMINKKGFMKYLNEFICADSFVFSDLMKEDGLCIVQTADKSKKVIMLTVQSAARR